MREARISSKKYGEMTLLFTMKFSKSRMNENPPTSWAKIDVNLKYQNFEKNSKIIIDIQKRNT